MVVLPLVFRRQNLYIIIIARNKTNPLSSGRKKDKMRMPLIWDGTTWRKSTKDEYENIIVNVPVYGKANYIMPDVWTLPVVNTNATTGSKVVKCGKSVQFRFSCARSTKTAQAVRAYKIAFDKDARAGVQFNYEKSGSCFIFETTFCGSVSALKKFPDFTSITIKYLFVRVRDEQTSETSNFKKFEYNNLTLGLIRYLRDTMDIKGYNNLKISDLDVVPADNIYGIKVTI